MGAKLNESSAELQITPLLIRWHEGDQGVLDELMPLIYHQLSLIARKHMRGERAGHTFSTTDLVHEAYLKLFKDQDKKWAGRAHFFALAGRAMRNILINHAAGKNTLKRGGSEFERATVALHDLGDRPHQVLSDMDEAIARLERRDKNAALAVELRYFCGLTLDEMAEVLSISPATIKRKLAFARVWLGRYLD